MASGEAERLPGRGTGIFYGYIVVAACFFVFLGVWGPFNSFGVFFKPLLTEFGWSSAMTSGAFSLSMIVSGVIGIFAGGLSDRFGPRLVITLCGVLLGLGFLLMARVNAPWQVYMIFAVAISTGVSGGYVPPLATVARWFVGRRGLMTSIVVSGTSIGGLVVPPVISRLIYTYDWRLAYVITGSAVLVVLVVAAQFLKRDPSRMGQQPYGDGEGKPEGLKSGAAFTLREAAATRPFWVFFFMLFCLGFITYSVMVHIVPHAIELGLTAAVAANILAVSLGIRILGALIFGSAGDRTGRRPIFIIGYALMVVTLLWLVQARETWMFYIFALVLGIAQGGVVTSEAPQLARLFGLGSLGAIFGVTVLGYTIGGSIGVFVTGYIHDLTGSYQAAFLLWAAVAAVGLILAVILRPPRQPGKAPSAG